LKVEDLNIKVREALLVIEKRINQFEALLKRGRRRNLGSYDPILSILELRRIRSWTKIKNMSSRADSSRPFDFIQKEGQMDIKKPFDFVINHKMLLDEVG